MIQVENLTKTYPDLRRGQVVALDGLTFTARPGEVYGLLGPNGAGKTTCLRILATVIAPTAGRATIAGVDVVAEPLEVRRRIGFMSASTGLYDRLTAYEIVRHFGRLHGLDGDPLEARIETLFSRLGINDFRDRVVSKMSTGMKQKVSIARAIVHDPPVVIFDEPTTGLDVLVSRAVLEVIADCRRPDRCVIFSTHIMSEAERLCDRLTIIHQGRELITGSLDELRARTGRDRLEEMFFSLLDAGAIAQAVRRGERDT